MSKPSGVTISILDKQYQIACPDDQRDSLSRSAQYLDQQMRDIRATGKVVGLDRIAAPSVCSRPSRARRDSGSAAS